MLLEQLVAGMDAQGRRRTRAYERGNGISGVLRGDGDVHAMGPEPDSSDDELGTLRSAVSLAAWRGCCALAIVNDVHRNSPPPPHHLYNGVCVVTRLTS